MARDSWLPSSFIPEDKMLSEEHDLVHLIFDAVFFSVHHMEELSKKRGWWYKNYNIVAWDSFSDWQKLYLEKFDGFAVIEVDDEHDLFELILSPEEMYYYMAVAAQEFVKDRPETAERLEEILGNYRQNYDLPPKECHLRID